MTDKKPEAKTLKLGVTGMHCSNCEVLVERKLKAHDGVQRGMTHHE